MEKSTSSTENTSTCPSVTGGPWKDWWRPENTTTKWPHWCPQHVHQHNPEHLLSRSHEAFPKKKGHPCPWNQPPQCMKSCNHTINGCVPTRTELHFQSQKASGNALWKWVPTCKELMGQRDGLNGNIKIFLTKHKWKHITLQFIKHSESSAEQENYRANHLY